MKLTTVNVMEDQKEVAPTNTIWTSGSDAVATVTDAGVVTGVILSGGKTTITPTSDGETGYSATVHVVPAP